MYPNSSKHFRYSICVSGAAAGETTRTSSGLAEELGRAIASSGQILTTGATGGLPYHAAYGAKKAGGVSIGFSPAASLREHVRKYHLPYDSYDFINFTGLHYVGRDMYLVQSSDAVITVGGRFGSLHEFTSALEAKKPCGVLRGSGGTADKISELMRDLEPPGGEMVIYEDDPAELVRKILKILDEKYADIHKQLERDRQKWLRDKKH